MVLWLCLLVVIPVALTNGFAPLGKELSRSIKGQVLVRGSVAYEKRRLIHNGLCTHLFPDWIVVPERTEDVVEIVKITNKYNVPISVRSGGHSFTCTSTKQGGVHLDMRRMNRIALAGPDLAILGPGGTWADVLAKLPPDQFTMIHGQCTSVGVGGYILGGGVNVVGTSERYGSAADHVQRYTMVDAKGRILLVSKGNTTVIEPYSGRALYQLENDRGLYEAMGGAGSSFGIATEFLYKIYPRPETQPIIAMIYIEDNYDLRKLEKAAKDGRFHVSWFIAYANRNLGLGVLSTALGTKLLPKLLKITAFKTVEPIFVQLVDNSPNAGRHTDRHDAMEFLKEFDIRLAKDDIFANILPNMLELTDYEQAYMSTEEIKRRGFQGVASANLMGLTSQAILDDFVFNHPVFGIRNRDSKSALRSGCEFCYLVVPSSNRQQSILPLTYTGPFQVELTCMFDPNGHSRCPHILRNVKDLFRRKALASGDRPTQYANTPSCDKKTSFAERYFSPGVYEKLLASKWAWDPENKFNHCQSIGSTSEDCCPTI